MEVGEGTPPEGEVGGEDVEFIQREAIVVGLGGTAMAEVVRMDSGEVVHMMTMEQTRWFWEEGMP